MSLCLKTEIPKNYSSVLLTKENIKNNIQEGSCVKVMEIRWLHFKSQVFLVPNKDFTQATSVLLLLNWWPGGK